MVSSKVIEVKSTYDDFALQRSLLQSGIMAVSLFLEAFIVRGIV